MFFRSDSLRCLASLLLLLTALPGVSHAQGQAGAAAAVAVEAGRPMAARGPVADTIAERVRPCTACHGQEGRATNAGYFPRIAGKPAGYLFEQLANFRDGRRRHAAMAGLLTNLSDDYLREMAGYFAGLELPYPPPQTRDAPPVLLARGEALVRRGDPARGLPACADCHGARLTGAVPAIPGLLGLPRDYLNAQFGAWRAGQRHAASPDCMAEVASKLSPQDVEALSTWLSSQPVPPDARPDRAPPKSMPMPCGGVAGTPAAAQPPVAPRDVRVERGRYLALAGNCAGCHTGPGGRPYAGGTGVPTPFGTVFPGNLTPDRGTGIGDWTADDFWRAMREGRSRDGRLLYPAFPYPNYTRITREDSDALFAWLRTLPPVERANRPHRLRFPYGTQAALAAWRALYFRPESFTPDASRSEAWNRGAYLVTALGHCSACHSPRNALGATREEARLGGGLIPVLGWYAPSLASPAEAGFAGWSAQEAVQLLGTGVSSRAGTGGPMAEVVHRSLQHLSRSDLEAMVAYLQALPQGAAASRSPSPSSRASASLPPASGSSPASLPSPAASTSVDNTARGPGAALYERHCAQCHGDDGRGRPAGGRPAYPALAGNRAVTMASPVNVVRAVLAGGYLPSTEGNPRPFGMPPFAHLLGDADVAAVASFVRGSWGNAAGPVSPLEVQRLRDSAR